MALAVLEGGDAGALPEVIVSPDEQDPGDLCKDGVWEQASTDRQSLWAGLTHLVSSFPDAARLALATPIMKVVVAAEHAGHASLRAAAQVVGSSVEFLRDQAAPESLVVASPTAEAIDPAVLIMTNRAYATPVWMVIRHACQCGVHVPIDTIAMVDTLGTAIIEELLHPTMNSSEGPSPAAGWIQRLRHADPLFHGVDPEHLIAISQSLWETYQASM
jgi:hypothetical protein